MAGRATLTGMLVAVALAVLAIGSLAWLLKVAPSALFGIRAAADYLLGLQALALGLIPTLARLPPPSTSNHRRSAVGGLVPSPNR